MENIINIKITLLKKNKSTHTQTHCKEGNVLFNDTLNTVIVTYIWHWT